MKIKFVFEKKKFYTERLDCRNCGVSVFLFFGLKYKIPIGITVGKFTQTATCKNCGCVGLY